VQQNIVFCQWQADQLKAFSNHPLTVQESDVPLKLFHLRAWMKKMHRMIEIYFSVVNNIIEPKL